MTQSKNYKRILIDSVLEAMAAIECNLGSDTTKPDKIRAAWTQRKHIKNINKINPKYFIIIDPMVLEWIRTQSLLTKK